MSIFTITPAAVGPVDWPCLELYYLIRVLYGTVHRNSYSCKNTNVEKTNFIAVLLDFLNISIYENEVGKSYSRFHFDRPFSTEYGSNFFVYLLMVLVLGTPAWLGSGP